MDRKSRHHYYKHIVKRHLSDMRANIRFSKNEMERNCCLTCHATRRSVYAETLGVQEKYLERFIQK